MSSTIDLLADRWEGAGPLLACFPLLAQGEPLPIGRIAEAAGVDIQLIEQALRTARCKCDENGCLTDLFGMSLEPTHHRLEIEGRVVFSCCALWAHVIPRLVERWAEVESV
ncbi:MAG: organomercurial lyase, partial [Acidobacteriota bacterium]